MTEPEVTAADLWATGMSPDRHPVAVRPGPPRRAWARSPPTGLRTRPRTGRRVLVGGVVTHRQRPATAAGTVFVNLEDETGMLNVICSPPGVGPPPPGGPHLAGPAGRGRLERAEGVTNLVADRIEPLSLSVGAGQVPRLPLSAYLTSRLVISTVPITANATL